MKSMTLFSGLRYLQYFIISRISFRRWEGALIPRWKPAASVSPTTTYIQCSSKCITAHVLVISSPCQFSVTILSVLYTKTLLEGNYFQFQTVSRWFYHHFHQSALHIYINPKLVIRGLRCPLIKPKNQNFTCPPSPPRYWCFYKTQPYFIAPSYFGILWLWRTPWIIL